MRTAFEMVQPYCPCGLALERPQSLVRPSSAGVEVRCSCGAVVAAQFWRPQTVLIVGSKLIGVTDLTGGREYVDAIGGDGARLTLGVRR